MNGQLKIIVTLILKKQGLGNLLETWCSPKLFSHDAVSSRGGARDKALVLSPFLCLYSVGILSHNGSGALPHLGGSSIFLAVI